MDPRDAYDVTDLKALRCFLATAKHTSLTRAGIELGISEAAVSQRLRALETHLGAKLYEARGGRVRLTPAGQKAFDLALDVFQRLADLRQAVAAEEVAGAVTLAAHDPVLRYLLPDVAARFARAYPRARLRLLDRSPREVVELVRLNEADAGIVPERPLPVALRFHPWCTHDAYLVVPRGHPLGRRARASFDDLLIEATARQHPLVVPQVDEPDRQRLAQALRRRGLPYNVGIEVGTVETVKHYVARGLGIAVLPGLCLTDRDQDSLEAIPLPRELGGATTYGIVCRRDKRPSDPLKGLLALLGVTIDQASSEAATPRAGQRPNRPPV